MDVGQFGERLGHAGLVGEHVLRQALVAHRRHVGDGHGGGDRMAAERGTVHIGAHGRVVDRLDQLAAYDDAAEGLVGGGDALGESDHVGHDAHALAGEPVAEAPERADDLVSDQEDPVAVADAA